MVDCRLVGLLMKCLGGVIVDLAFDQPTERSHAKVIASVVNIGVGLI